MLTKVTTFISLLFSHVKRFKKKRKASWTLFIHSINRNQRGKSKYLSAAKHYFEIIFLFWFVNKMSIWMNPSTNKHIRSIITKRRTLRNGLGLCIPECQSNTTKHSQTNKIVLRHMTIPFHLRIALSAEMWARNETHEFHHQTNHHQLLGLLGYHDHGWTAFVMMNDDYDYRRGIFPSHKEACDLLMQNIMDIPGYKVFTKEISKQELDLQIKIFIQLLLENHASIFEAKKKMSRRNVCAETTGQMQYQP